MPIDASRIGFRPVTAADLPLLATWLEAPHIRDWWGDPEEELGFIRAMVEGRDTTRPYLILLDGEAAGYIQVWYIGHHQNESWTKDNPWLLDLPADTVGIDLSIGDASNLSIGLGSSALQRFVAMLRAEGHETIIIDPDPANTRAVRAYEKAGFRPIPALEGRTGEDVLVMQHDLKANETP